MSESTFTYHEAVKTMLTVFGKSIAELCSTTGIDYSTLKKLNKPNVRPSKLVHYAVMAYLKDLR